MSCLPGLRRDESERVVGLERASSHFLPSLSLFSFLQLSLFAFSSTHTHLQHILADTISMSSSPPSLLSRIFHRRRSSETSSSSLSAREAQIARLEEALRGSPRKQRTPKVIDEFSELLREQENPPPVYDSVENWRRSESVESWPSLSFLSRTRIEAEPSLLRSSFFDSLKCRSLNPDWSVLVEGSGEGSRSSTDRFTNWS